MPIQLYLFGSPHIAHNNEPISFRRRKGQALLAYLAVTQRPQSRETLLGLLWPEFSAASARNNLRRELSLLRKKLDQPIIDSDAAQIGLAPDAPLWVDVGAFQDGVGSVASIGSEEGARQLETAVSLYNDDFLAGFSLPNCLAFEEWHHLQATQLRQNLSSSLAKLVDWHQQQKNYDQALHFAQRWLALDTLHELAHRQLMTLYAQAGQQGAALRQYQTCVDLLESELGVAPEAATTTLAEAIKAQEFEVVPIDRPKADAGVSKTAVLPPAPATQLTPLPQPAAPLVGRKAELARLHQLLTAEPACRLLTVTGSGGMGKTRLALEAAHKTADFFTDGIAFISLAAVEDPDILPETVATALNIPLSGHSPPAELIKNYLQPKQMLLVLDNFEQLVDTQATWLAELLRHAASLTLLVTSRERLNVQEEWALPLAGLVRAVQNGAEATDASRLFMQRARQSLASFAPSAAEQEAIARICQLVEGWPLGLELAASWVKMLSCAEIAAEISASFDFLESQARNIPARHRSMRAVMRHAWLRLTPREQQVMQALAVFRGGFQREAAKQVAGASLAVLSSLVDKSLLTVVRENGRFHQSTTARYDMHPLLRQFLAEKVEPASSHAQQLNQQHSHYFAQFAAQTYEHYLAGHFRAAIASLSQESNNLRVAWRWLVQQLGVAQAQDVASKVAQLAQLLQPLAWYYRQRARYLEGTDTLQLALDNLNMMTLLVHQSSPKLAEQLKIVRAKLQSRLANLHYYMGNYQLAEDLIASALPVLQAAQLPAEEGLALVFLAKPTRRRGDYTKTKALAEQSQALFQQAGSQYGQILALMQTAVVAADEGDYGLAEQTGLVITAFFRQLNDTANLVMTQTNLANTYFRQQKYSEAKPLLEEAYRLAQEDNNRFSVMMSQTNLAMVEQALSNFAGAKKHALGGLELAREMGNKRFAGSSLNALSQNELAQQQWQAAAAYAREALAINHQIENEADGLGDMSCLARAWAHQGKVEPALRILSFVAQHPATITLDKERNRRLQDELRRELPPALVETAVQWAAIQSFADVATWIQKHPSRE
ncbi:MAG: BTAD domain-containing putative transcriptional regulator [Chloroflexota bacterium]